MVTRVTPDLLLTLTLVIIISAPWSLVIQQTAYSHHIGGYKGGGLTAVGIVPTHLVCCDGSLVCGTDCRGHLVELFLLIPFKQ